MTRPVVGLLRRAARELRPGEVQREVGAGVGGHRDPVERRPQRRAVTGERLQHASRCR